MSEITASLAHEINQPLAAILTNSEACLRWLKRPVPDMNEARQAVERTVEDAKRASGIIRQVRAIFTRKEPEPVAFDLNMLVERTIPLLHSQIGQHDASATLDLAAAAEMPHPAGRPFGSKMSEKHKQDHGGFADDHRYRPFQAARNRRCREGG